MSYYKHLEIEPDLHKRFKKYVHDHDKTMRKVVSELITKYLEDGKNDSRES